MTAKFYPIFILLLISALRGIAQQALPPAVEKVIREANLKRHEALRARFEPMIRDLDRASGNLYMDAVFNVFFAKDPHPQVAWRDWQKKNKEIANDPVMPLAVQVDALYLKGHLLLLTDNEQQAVLAFEAALQRLAKGPSNLVRFHLLQESVSENLLTKFYKIDTGNFKEEARYYGSLSDPEQLFVKNILPWYQAHNPPGMGGAWDAAISACKQISAMKEGGLAKFELTEHPRLMAQKAESLWNAGQKKAASKH